MKTKKNKAEEKYIQVGPSLFMDEAGDPTAPPYKRYVTWTPRKRKGKEDGKSK